MNNIESNNMSGLVLENEKINLEFLDIYLYLVQKESDTLVKIWYKESFADAAKFISINCDPGKAQCCIDAIELLMCKDGLIGLDYLDAFQYMGSEMETASFGEYLIRQIGDKPCISDIGLVKEICKNAKSGVVLICGWYTLLEAQEILQQLECDGIEIAFQVHVTECNSEGKLYLWVNNN